LFKFAGHCFFPRSSQDYFLRFRLASSGNSPSQTTSGLSAFFVSRELARTG
jgi:hypothetical protein